MTPVPLTRPRVYVPLIAGPRLDLAWTVTAGMVAVTGDTETITLPTGATWPGLDALPGDWLDELRFVEAVATPGATWVDAQAGALPAGLAHVSAQVLRAGLMTARLTRLDSLGLGGINQVAQAALIGSRRETISKVRCQMEREGR